MLDVLGVQKAIASLYRLGKIRPRCLYVMVDSYENASLTSIAAFIELFARADMLFDGDRLHEDDAERPRLHALLEQPAALHQLTDIRK